MVYIAYKGILTGGWLIFFLVVFSILAIVGLVWLFLYVETSQRREWKTTTLLIVGNALILAFEIILILVKAGVNF